MQQKIGRALVVGAGISGMRAALDLAETGYRVTLIDRAAHIGGILSQLDNQFPSNHCGMCQMLPLVQRDTSSQFCLRKGLFHENIDLRPGTELTSLEGEAGRFKVRLQQRPNPVDPQRCIGCGLCTAVCPVVVPDDFNAGLSTRKAIYLPVPHAIPGPYIIDTAACTHCGECAQACPSDAIALRDEKRRAFRILVVDDEPAVRDSLKEWLIDEGFCVDMAASGQDALAQLEAQSYGLMLSDVKMPGMDGVELLRRARKGCPDLTVVMMTAYATVQTAVDAMKIGALDYLMKPFDPAELVAAVVKIYNAQAVQADAPLQVETIVLACGCDFFDPRTGKNTYACGENPHVLTSIAFERLLSGCGPTHGRLVRPADGRAVNKIAWLQCVGSRDLQGAADFCSSVCCMASIKEALLAKEKAGHDIQSTIFYMDMRTFGKSFQRYRDQAAAKHGVRFVRARIHSVTSDAAGNPVLRVAKMDGSVAEKTFDMLVLAVGQRPPQDIGKLAQMTGCSLNPWGFLQSQPLFPARSSQKGIFIAGSAGGLQDIGESIILASAAATEAGRILHATGGSLAPESDTQPVRRDVSSEPARILVAVCSCHQRLAQLNESDRIARHLRTDPDVSQVLFTDHLCTPDGWDQLTRAVCDTTANRLLIAACHPDLFIKKLKRLSAQSGLPSELMEAVDLQLRTLAPFQEPCDSTTTAVKTMHAAMAALKMGIARLRHMDPMPAARVKVVQKALVIGGGIAGMTAALTIADRGYAVTLVEQSDQLGGNLQWLQKTDSGNDLSQLRETSIARVQKHPLIEVLLQAHVIGGSGQAGRFHASVQMAEQAPATRVCGAVILATGGVEAATTAYGYGRHASIVTQKELETRLADGAIDVKQLDSVVMIQCVESREPPRNYCSRVCCPTAIRQALHIRKVHPQTAVYVFYRDMMTPGFGETDFTAARRAGVIFIPYRRKRKPQVTIENSDNGGALSVRAVDPILAKPIEIRSDLLVLATGIVPCLPADLAATFGAACDADGFFEAAESKWRPVDALKEGVFACGLAHSPRPLAGTIATAQAAAQRALRIVSRHHLPAAKPTASVRPSLCSLCRRCIDTCPYSARMLNLDENRVIVNPAMCQGCGACASECPNGAAVLHGLDRAQVLETIDAALA